MMNRFKLTGLLPAVFSPMHSDGSLWLEQIPPLTEALIREGSHGFYICGSTGEGPCLSREERMDIAQAYISAAQGRIPMIVQVGHQSIAEAQKLAEHARDKKADAISAIPPNYFKPSSLDNLIDSLAEIAKVAPELPFYYYHIPAVTGVAVEVLELLEKAAERIPNFVGAKFSHSAIYEVQACLNAQSSRFNMLFGSDEMLLSALVVGVHGAVGSTYNFAGPLYQKIIKAVVQNDFGTAKHFQAKAVEMVRVLVKHGGNPAIKAMMSLIGLDCGGTRLPQAALNPSQIAALKHDMNAIGFFEWGRQLDS
ncbi:MAG: dihydrodipicolinate synthase family protein [Deinococcales bacterium]